jgi:hypothetical protein
MAPSVYGGLTHNDRSSGHTILNSTAFFQGTNLEDESASDLVELELGGPRLFVCGRLLRAISIRRTHERSLRPSEFRESEPLSRDIKFRAK